MVAEHARAGTGADLASELTEATMMLAKSIRRAGSAQVAPLGITFAQGRLLWLLAETGRLRMADIAARLAVVPRSATDQVDALEQAGLAARTADPADRRSVLVELTEAGRDVLRRMGEAKQQAAETVFGRLEETEQRELLALLRGVVARRPDGHCGRGKRGTGE
ncbi:MAG TPA: MarR family transcriptional regulator [Pseudonocardiaceae bacterium]|jgi:DNA-binding MarR family transcriptional regulator|nr:MarR family transcriptional regulator [Pseudonocardiaceae bacterium]